VQRGAHEGLTVFHDALIAKVPRDMAEYDFVDDIRDRVMEHGNMETWKHGTATKSSSCCFSHSFTGTDLCFPLLVTPISICALPAVTWGVQGTIGC